MYRERRISAGPDFLRELLLKIRLNLKAKIGHVLIFVLNTHSMPDRKIIIRITFLHNKNIKF